MTILTEQTTHSPARLLDHIELEITGSCQLTCTHCFTQSSPQGGHGAMTREDWRTVIADAAALGVSTLQLIGGEPMLYPHWVELVSFARAHDIGVEVYSNLFTVRPYWWDVLSQEGVTLATSYYSDDPSEHDRITSRPGSHERTRANIAEATRRRIPLRAGIVRVMAGQRVAEAEADLRALGVRSIRTDRVRAIGRGAAGAAPRVSELCGRCGRGQAAILPDGAVVPCVMGRFLPCGNVRSQRLADIVTGQAWAETVSAIPARAHANPCDPDCRPGLDGGDCAPAEQEACDPKY